MVCAIEQTHSWGQRLKFEFHTGGGLPASVKDCVPEGSKKKEIWDVPAGAVAGQTLSLNEIEHGVIRTRWDEPRVHACVNCASRSCPDLLGQAYRGDLCGNQPVS